MDSSATSYTYDGYNNRIGKNKNGVQTSYIYDNRNRLTKETTSENGQTAVTSYQYDPNGNLYSRQTLTYGENNAQAPKVSAVLMGYTAETDDMLLEYNNFNQLTATTGDEMVSYDYYANGMRKSKTVDGVTTTHIWDGQNMAGEITEDNFTGYLRGARLIARQMGDNTQYYHFNGHGDTSSITDGNGTTLRNYTYDAFGNLENLHDLDTNPFRYCGEYYDAETGFIYLRNRYYDPSMGRFISEDPVRDGLNWYVYCSSNPVNYIDSTGLKEVPLRAYIEGRGGSVNPVKKQFLWISYGLDHIDVSLNGKTVTYTGTEYKIDANKRSHIDDSILFRDFAILSPGKEVEGFIKDYEGGFHSTRYDANGNGDWTIGYGHKLFNDPIQTITKAQAEEYFKSDMERMVNTTFIPFLKENNIILSQNQFDAMLSFTFNFGENTWGPDGYITMKNFLKKGDFSEAATRAAFGIYMGSKAEPGQIARRNDEIDMFLYGNYDRNYNYDRP